MRFVPLLLLLTATAAHGQDYSRGEAMIEDYFRKQAAQIGNDKLNNWTKHEWERNRPELHRQLMEMLGLDPLPARTDLKPEITGKHEAAGYTVEKLTFQSFPGLYVTANFYLPRPLPKEKLPVVLYVCGHGNIVKKIDGTEVSFGSKVKYQHHPAWLAQHGYAALILDTLQLSEIPGIHHGTHRYGMWWWHTLGYTPAGIECWNGMRALDYLETRPEVDMKRVGLTGRSGGGAYSWYIAAADPRVQCIIPVAGIADLQAHLNEGYPGPLQKGVIAGHCDCMFLVNTYRWDFAKVAALCAPRPLLLGNSDKDPIFPVEGYRRLANQVKSIYAGYGKSENFQLLETKGAHVDTPELREGAFRWFNRWLKDEKGQIIEDKFTPVEPEDLKVLSRIPEAAINDRIHDYFIKPAIVDLPKSEQVMREWWPGQKAALHEALKSKVFRGWPGEPSKLNLKPAGDRTIDGVRLRSWDFTSEEGIELRLHLMTAGRTAKPTLVVLNALDEPDWATWCADLGPEFADMLRADPSIKRDDAKFKQNQRVMDRLGWAFAAVCPRGIGPTRWAAPGSPNDIQMRRRFALVGQTLDGQRVWDVRRGLSVLRAQPNLKGTPLWLQGKADMAGICLYAGLFEPDVARMDLWNPPTSHKEGPIFLNVRKYMEMPQALALAEKQQVRLYVRSADAAKEWDWPMQLQKAQGGKSLQIRVVGD